MTAIATQTINLDLRPHFNRQNNCIVYCSQYDNDLREVAVNIDDAGTAVNVSTYTIYIEGTKPDKKGFSYELTDIGGTVSNNVVTFPLQLQMTACAGITNAELVFYSGDDRVGSSNFILAVEKAGLADDIDVSDTDIPAYVDGAQQAAQAAEDAKDAAVDAKDTAVAVVASIPADYTTLSNDVDDLKSAFEQLPTSIQPDMTVGSLMSETYTEEKMPYLYRVSGGGVEVGKVEADEIVGGTVAWNQLAILPATGTQNGITITNNADGSLTIDGTATAESNFAPIKSPWFNGHVYYVAGFPTGTKAYAQLYKDSTWKENKDWRTFDIKKITSTVDANTVFFSHYIPNGTAFNNVKYYPMVFDLTQMFGTTIADYIYSLETATAGAGVAVFRKLFPNAYYPYNAGELMHVSGVSEHVMTGKNLLPSISASETKNGVTATLLSDGSIRFSGQASANAVWNLARNVLILPSGTYYSNLTANNVTVTVFKIVDGTATAIKNGGGLFTLTEETSVFLRLSVSNGTSVNTVVYPQIEIGSTATAYEPYEKHTYPLDSSLTLRGLPKLDASNNLYYDGDTYESDGKVTRKYAVVDLGTLTWEAWTGYAGVYSTPLTSNCKTMPNNNTLPNWIAPIYKTVIGTDISSNNKTIGQLHQTYLVVHDDSYSTASDFKTAMNGVYLVYELATPTTENAEPYAEYQHVTNGGTEEYVSTGIVPVGHNTKYYGDIGSKVDKLPSDFSTIIAPTESAFKATRSYTVNELIIINNVLYKVTASIASGATITPNTNVTQTTLSALIKALS